jgi:oligopeptide transport system substrate-binding protein
LGLSPGKSGNQKLMSKIGNYFLSLILIVSALILIGGCAFSGSDSSVSARDWQKLGVNPQDAILLVGSQPRTLDPAKTLTGPDDALGHIFSGLVMLNSDLQVQPDLAAGWEVSDDGLLYTFYLNPNAQFHDGRPLTAQDVVYSWERAADPQTGSDMVLTYLGNIAGLPEKTRAETDQIAGLTVIDEHTFSVRLAEPDVTFLAKLAYPVSFVVDRENVTKSDWEHHPNGSGPFKLQTWQDDDLIILQRNDNYYREPALVSHVTYDLGPGLPLSMYETGQIDLVGIDSNTLERVQDPNDEFYDDLRTVVTMCTSTIGLNNQLAPFDDPLVRQAFNYALDKERLIETFAGGNALVANGPLPPGMPGYGGLEGESYPYDVEKARALLAEAGYEDPADLGTLTFTTQGYGDVGPYITAVITLWQEALGVSIEPEMLDPYLYYDELYAGDIGHFFSSGWCADYPDPQNFLEVLYHTNSEQNLTHFSDPGIDELLDQARVEQDVSRRLGMYQEAERRIVQAAPVVFLSHGIAAELVNPNLEGYKLTAIGIPQWQRVTKKQGS